MRSLTFAFSSFLPKVPERRTKAATKLKVKNSSAACEAARRKRESFDSRKALSTRVQDTTEGEDIAGWSAKEERRGCLTARARRAAQARQHVWLHVRVHGCDTSLHLSSRLAFRPFALLQGLNCIEQPRKDAGGRR
jgi:hypothetical protein